MKTFVENVLDVVENRGINRDCITIEYSKMRFATITISIPQHEFVIEQIPCGEFDGDDMLYTECATELYAVYRNGSFVFIGNDMYDKLFYMLLDTALSNIQ